MTDLGQCTIARPALLRLVGSSPTGRLLQSPAFPGGEADGIAMRALPVWSGCLPGTPGDRLVVSGRTLGGMAMYGDDNRLEREEALRLWTHGSAWFSNDQEHKGRLAVGQHADFSLLSADFFDVEEESIKDITSVLTVVAGNIVHGDGEFSSLAPILPTPMPDWSPIKRFGGYQGGTLAMASAAFANAHNHVHEGSCGVHKHGHAGHRAVPTQDLRGFWGALGCSCFAF